MTRLVVRDLQVNVNVLLRKFGAKPLGPFDDGHTVAAQDFVQADLLDFYRISDAIQVDMVQTQSSRVFVDQGKSGAGNIIFGRYMQALSDALDESRLAAAEITCEGDCGSGGGLPTESFAERPGFFNRMGCGLARETLHWTTALLLRGLPIEFRTGPSAEAQCYDSRSRLISDGMASMTSDAR